MKDNTVAPAFHKMDAFFFLSRMGCLPPHGNPAEGVIIANFLMVSDHGKHRYDIIVCNLLAWFCLYTAVLLSSRMIRHQSRIGSENREANVEKRISPSAAAAAAGPQPETECQEANRRACMRAGVRARALACRVSFGSKSSAFFQEAQAFFVSRFLRGSCDLGRPGLLLRWPCRVQLDLLETCLLRTSQDDESQAGIGRRRKDFAFSIRLVSSPRRW